MRTVSTATGYGDVHDVTVITGRYGTAQQLMSYDPSHGARSRSPFVAPNRRERYSRRRVQWCWAESWTWWGSPWSAHHLNARRVVAARCQALLDTPGARA